MHSNKGGQPITRYICYGEKISVPEAEMPGGFLRLNLRFEIRWQHDLALLGKFIAVEGGTQKELFRRDHFYLTLERGKVPLAR